MIHVFITAHPSRRYPGKNRRLAPYTILWLLNEMAYLEEPVRVYTVGLRSEFPFRLPIAWKHIATREASHQAALEVAEKAARAAAGDILMLLQLTQPLREHGLMERAAALMRRGFRSCITAADMPECAWRAVTESGQFTNKAHASRVLADGHLYAWKPGNLADIFNPAAPHGIIRTSHRWGMVDVNERGDVPPALDAMAGELLYAPMDQPPLYLRGRSVLLIGSGKDLVGRALGKRIDAGEWDLVVRCNHYYGDPEDVGTRTDLAIVREQKLQKEFIDEAPVAPMRIVATVEGNEFPLQVLVQAAKEVGHKEASCGVIAARWLLNAGAHVSVIGIGHNPNGSWAKTKLYPSGLEDTATFCDWEKEHRWWECQKNVTLL